MQQYQLELIKCPTESGTEADGYDGIDDAPTSEADNMVNNDMDE